MEYLDFSFFGSFNFQFYFSFGYADIFTAYG